MQAFELAEILMKHPYKKVRICYDEIEGHSDDVKVTTWCGHVEPSDIRIEGDTICIDNRR